MPKNVLYVFDSSSSIEKLILKINENKFSKIFLCSNTISIETENLINFQLSKARIDFEILPYAKKNNDNSIDRRDDFIKFISDFAEMPIFSNKNIKTYFKYPAKDFSIWWFSLISEKNTLKSKAYNLLVKLITILELINQYKCDSVWIDLENKELSNAIKNNCGKMKIACRDLKNNTPHSVFLEIIRHFLKNFWEIRKYISLIFYARKKMVGMKERFNFLAKSKYILVTYFPCFEKDKLKNGKFVDKYYKPLQEALEKKYKDCFSWMALICPNLDGYSWFEAVELSKKVNQSGQNLFIYEEFLDFGALIEILVLYIYFSIKFLFSYKRIFKKFTFGAENILISSLFEDNWIKSFSGFTLFEGICFYKAFNKFFKYVKDNSTVLYIAEMHAWEKALNVALRENANLKSIGIQHTIVSLLHLMYFNHKNDLLDGNYVDKMPKPDYLACVGGIPYKLFLESGWSKDKLFILGPIRSQHYKDLLKKEIPWNDRQNRIIIALPIGFEEAKEVLSFAYSALKEEKKIEILVKGHPSNPVSIILDSLKISLNDNFKVVNAPLSELIISSKALITTASSVCLESLACYCPVIVPRLISTIDMNPLSWISDIQINVENPEQLRDVVLKIMASQEQYVSREKCKMLIENYCGFLDSNEQFLEKLEEKIGNI